MSGYDENRRVPKVRRLAAVSKNEAAEGSDLRRETMYIEERERIADDRRAELTGSKRRFDSLLKKP